MADRCSRYTLNSEPGDIYEQVKKMFLFGKDNFTEINSVCRLQADQREVSEGCLPNAPTILLL